MGLMPTGIESFDILINGGFKTSHKITVCGSPGTGKSIFCAQFIYNGIIKYGQPGVYISTQEKKEEFYNNMLNFGMDFSRLEQEGKFLFIEQGFLKEEFFDIMGLLDKIHDLSAKRVVFDSINFFEIKYPDPGKRNLEMLSYMRGLSGSDRVSLWVTENYDETLVYTSAHFLSDGLIYFQHLDAYEGLFNRTLSVIKLRGIRHDDKRHPFIIDSTGIKLKKI